MNELRRMQEEVARSKGTPPDMVDSEGFSRPAQGPKPDVPTVDKNQDVRTLLETRALAPPTLPVEIIDLKNRSIRGTSGTWQLDSEQVDQLTYVGLGIVEGVIQRLKPVLNTPKRKTASDTTAEIQPEKGVIRAKAMRRSPKGTKRKGVTKGTTRTTSKSTPEQQQG